MGELERIERRLIELETQQRVVLGVQAQTVKVLARILALLEPPTRYPASSGGSISVK